jgi:hypothetical protein
LHTPRVGSSEVVVVRCLVVFDYFIKTVAVVIANYILPNYTFQTANRYSLHFKIVSNLVE